MQQVKFITIKSPVEYGAMLKRQLAVRDAVENGSSPNTVFLLEHAPTVTLGRRARAEHICAGPDELSRLGIQVVATDRGGDVTYHGPGQMVAYPILNLGGWRLSVDWYLRALEDTVIRLLAGYGIRGERLAGYTGVWVKDGKVAAIGVSVRKWITWHGIALNVNPDETHWGTIIPCGISDKPVTSLAQLMEAVPSPDAVMNAFIKAFSAVFACEACHDAE